MRGGANDLSAPYGAVTGSVLCSQNSRKAFTFLRKHLDLLLYGNQYCYVHFFLHKMAYLWYMRSSRGGELSLSVCLGGGE